MELYSYKNQEPTSLPFRVILDDGLTRTSLNDLSNEELTTLGFNGPIVKPECNEQTQKISWNGTSYDIIELTDEEMQLKTADEEGQAHVKRLNSIDYYLFWSKLISSQLYKKLRAASIQSLEANVLCTELISLFSDAKLGRPQTGKIQEHINILFLKFDITAEEKEELQNIINETNLDTLYTLPDSEYLSTHTYDSTYNVIVGPKPYADAILVNGEWTAPLPYPTDGKNYQWDDSVSNWTEIYD